MWFVVFNDSDLDLIGKILDKAGVTWQGYHADIVDGEAPVSQGMVPPAIPFLTTRYVDLYWPAASQKFPANLEGGAKVCPATSLLAETFYDQSISCHRNERTRQT